MRLLKLTLVLPLLLIAVPGIAADDYGSPEEAKAMLEKTVEQMKSDKEGTIEAINAGEIKDRDLYPYCADMEGNFTAHPSATTRELNLMELKDKTGKEFGKEIYETAVEGEVNEVEYMWPRPGEEEPAEKVVYVTVVEDQVCGVGYYK